MIDRNLGSIERVLRFALGLSLFGWVLMQPAMNGLGWFVSLIALFLTLNGIYGRCYLWHLLEISSCGCTQPPQNRFCDKTTA